MEVIGSFLVFLMLGWLVWSGFSSGRAASIGPERRFAPVSFWAAQAVLAFMALIFLARTLLAAWALAITTA